MSFGVRALCPPLLLLAFAGGPVWSQTGGVAPGELGRLVPSDSALYFHYEADEASRLSELLHGFRESLRSAGFFDTFTEAFLASLKDLRDVLSQRAGGEPDERARERLVLEVERIDAEILRRGLDGAEWERILVGVDWWKLFAKEIAVAARVQGGQREWLFAFRSTESERDQRLAELQQVLYGLGAVIPGLELLVSTWHGVPVTVLYNVFSPGEELCIGGTGDVVFVATSRSLLRRSCQLALQGGSDLGVTRLPRFTTAMSDLAHAAEFFPERGFSSAGFQFLVEPARFLHELSSLRGLHRYTLAGDIADADIVYASTTEFSDNVGSIDDEGGDETEEHEDEVVDVPSLDEVFLARMDINDFARFVPSGVDWFAASSGSEPELFLEFLLAVARQSRLVDDAALKRFDLQTEDTSARFRTLLLSQLTGRRAVFHLDGSWAVVWEYAKPIRGGLDGWNELAAHLDEVAPTVFKASPAGATLREVNLPLDAYGGLEALEPFLGEFGPSLTVGSLDNVFVIASSADTLARIRHARTGEATVLGDPSFKAAWPKVSGELHAVSYGEASRLVAWLAAGIRTGPGVLRSVASLEDSLLGPLLGGITRLAPAVGRLDFLGTAVARTIRVDNRLHGAGRIQLESSTRRGF